MFLVEELCTKEENDKTGCNFNFGHECRIRALMCVLSEYSQQKAGTRLITGHNWPSKPRIYYIHVLTYRTPWLKTGQWAYCIFFTQRWFFFFEQTRGPSLRVKKWMVLDSNPNRAHHSRLVHRYQIRAQPSMVPETHDIRQFQDIQTKEEKLSL